MKRILTFSLTLACIFSLTKLSAQNPTTGASVSSGLCDLVVEDFTTDPVAKGYSISGFVYSGTQLSGQTLRVASAGASTDYIMTSPAFYLFSGGTAKAGFNLTTSTGSNNYFQNGTGNTLSTTLDILDITGMQVLASYNVSLTAAGAYCFSLTDADVKSGAYVRYRFMFTTSAGVTGTRVLDFDNFTVATNQQAPLPVTFTSVAGKTVGTTKSLTWNVASELNVLRYEVERSGNNKSYTKIGEVLASGLVSYTYTDLLPLSATNYYRIKAIDIDGKYKYSPIITIRSTKTAVKLNAYPVPADATITLQHDATTTSKGVISISSIDGRLIKTIVPAIGAQETTIDLSTAKPGLYMVRFENGDGEVETIKIIKQ